MVGTHRKGRRRRRRKGRRRRRTGRRCRSRREGCSARPGRDSAVGLRGRGDGPALHAGDMLGKGSVRVPNRTCESDVQTDAGHSGHWQHGHPPPARPGGGKGRVTNGGDMRTRGHTNIQDLPRGRPIRPRVRPPVQNSSTRPSVSLDTMSRGHAIDVL